MSAHPDTRVGVLLGEGEEIRHPRRGFEVEQTSCMSLHRPSATVCVAVSARATADV